MPQKTYPSGTEPSRRTNARRDRSWSLLMVGDHGQIIPFRRVKGIAVTLIVIATLAALAAVGLGVWAGWLRVQNAGLQSELTASRDAVRALKDEKDLLMAKVVILETRSNKGPAGTAAAGIAAAGTAGADDNDLDKPATAASAAAPKAAQPTNAEPRPPVAVEKKAAVGASAKSAPETATEMAAAVAPPPAKSAKATATAALASGTPVEAAPKVSVSAFIADHSPRRGTLSASFQIKNTGLRGRKISGRCVLVLKNQVKDDHVWVSVPRVSLISGRPNGKQGRAFRIANFMTLKMQTDQVPDNFAFETGSLYVFDDEGNQILEQEVPVQLSYRKPKPAPEPKPEPKTAPQPALPSPPAAQGAKTSSTPARPAAGSPSGVPPVTAPKTAAPSAAASPMEAADNAPPGPAPDAGETPPPSPAPAADPASDPSLLPEGGTAPAQDAVTMEIVEPATPPSGAAPEHGGEDAR